MPRTIVTLNNPTLKLADTEAGLTAGDAYECQLTSATITPTANFQTIPATGCAPPAQSPGKTSYALDLAWLQDWTAAGGGLSSYAYDNDTLPKWFELTLDSVAAPTVKATGQVYVTAGGYGGTFGDGTPAATTATWPCLDKPDIVTPVVALAATETEGATGETSPPVADGEPVVAAEPPPQAATEPALA